VSDAQAVTVFKALADPVRLRLFYLLSLGDELCVCHLIDVLHLPQSTVSRHLGVLRNAGLVQTRRDGKWVHYRVTGEAAASLSPFVRANLDTTQRADAERLSTLSGCQ
jgi:ArsR family transcriptional regulator, arsenate/arsenite/antimonite-responsive transcriptional repressor